MPSSMPSLAQIKRYHLETLQEDDLPHLIERRQAIYAAMECDIDAIEYARLFDMMMWATEQIVYLKQKLNSRKAA